MADLDYSMTALPKIRKNTFGKYAIVDSHGKDLGFRLGEIYAKGYSEVEKNIDAPFAHAYVAGQERKGQKVLISAYGTKIECEEDAFKNSRISADCVYHSPQYILFMIDHGFFHGREDDLSFYLDIISARFEFDRGPRGEKLNAEDLEKLKEQIEQHMSKQYDFDAEVNTVKGEFDRVRKIVRDKAEKSRRVKKAEKYLQKARQALNLEDENEPNE